MEKEINLYMVGTEDCYFDIDTWFVTDEQYAEIKKYKDKCIDYLDEMEIDGLHDKVQQLLDDQYEIAQGNGQGYMEFHVLVDLPEED